MTSADRRRDAVARILRSRRISTQEELLEALAAAGVRATQATLSRDLARLGARRVEAGAITGGMKWKAQSILTALAGGVERVHVLDGRQPHTVIAELFTDRGVGSLVTAG